MSRRFWKQIQIPKSVTVYTYFLYTLINEKIGTVAILQAGK